MTRRLSVTFLIFMVATIPAVANPNPLATSAIDALEKLGSVATTPGLSHQMYQDRAVDTKILVDRFTSKYCPEAAETPYTSRLMGRLIQGDPVTLCKAVLRAMNDHFFAISVSQTETEPWSTQYRLLYPLYENGNLSPNWDADLVAGLQTIGSPADEHAMRSCPCVVYFALVKRLQQRAAKMVEKARALNQ